jgi:hypothetical protein
LQVGDTGPAESTRQGNLQRVGLLFLGSRDSHYQVRYENLDGKFPVVLPGQAGSCRWRQTGLKYYNAIIEKWRTQLIYTNPDPYLWTTDPDDPDPAFFSSGFQVTIKI